MNKLSLDSVEWKEFIIGDIFENIQRGKRLIKKNQIDGLTPYISSKGINNGVDNYIDNSINVREFSKCLTIANSGSVGACFYHDYKFVASDHVTSLKIKEGNKYIYIFLSNIIKKLEQKYSFNREINDTRINNEIIMLPIDEKGEPNWGFMENYIKQMMNRQKSQIINYYKSQLSDIAYGGGGFTK